jgi:hypothetical protein
MLGCARHFPHRNTFPIFQLLEEIAVKNSTLRKFVCSALLSAVVVLAGSAAVLAQGQPAGPRYVSPRRSVELPLPGQKKVMIDYGSPEAHGRKMIGEKEPLDKVWRFGANKATHLTTDVDLVIGGETVPAGTYTLFAIPAKDKWTLIINKTTGQWGIPYKPEYEQTVLAKVNMKVETLSAPQERFLITLSQTGQERWLIAEWENWRVSVPITLAPAK